ncbi:hypothetical protein [Blastopirellula marina]|uniref:Uncharacterized protein n=1 Tax=Blastopirellula marina DSM 3645 TaxID=314230 RepID=A3ZN74_9BACT|nr:hypothetical protein [Blastopirellula marina]EAQ81766.1 hypothetical protein DSM3645_16480 [Blastopirellula marina DSM 3645]
MTWLTVGGGACMCVVLFFALVIVFLYFYSSYNEAATERRIRENGKPVLAVLVMANSEFLQQQSIASAPALMIFSHEPPSKSLAEVLRELADDLFDLYTADDEEIAGLPPHQQHAAELLKNDAYHKGRRNRVPLELTRGRVIYMADVWIERECLPDHVALSRVLACLVTGLDEGEIMALPPDEAAAKQIYAAVGAGE